MVNEAVLRTENLSKRFGGVVAADRIDFSLRRGEMRCVIGPNGAGKSTFFALLCGILRPDTGDVFLHGRAVTRLPAFRRVRLGLGPDVSDQPCLPCADRGGESGDRPAWR